MVSGSGGRRSGERSGVNARHTTSIKSNKEICIRFAVVEALVVSIRKMRLFTEELFFTRVPAFFLRLLVVGAGWNGISVALRGWQALMTIIIQNCVCM